MNKTALDQMHEDLARISYAKAGDAPAMVSNDALRGRLEALAEFLVIDDAPGSADDIRRAANRIAAAERIFETIVWRPGPALDLVEAWRAGERDKLAELPSAPASIAERLASSEASAARLWDIIGKLAEAEWVLGTAYDGSDFGWVVHTRCPAKKRVGHIKYIQRMDTFALTPQGAALKAYALGEPEASNHGE